MTVFDTSHLSPESEKMQKELEPTESEKMQEELEPIKQIKKRIKKKNV
tara:strand:- start:1369 stop:1512 length:144 start_codon:yes stop_codon:yes gene_type:complete